MKRLLLVVMSAAAVMSCTRSEIQGPQSKGQLSFAVTQTPFQASDIATRAIESGTAGGTSFQNDDAIGVYVHTSAAVAGQGNHSTNMRYVTSDKGATWKAANALGGELLSGTTYRATAYYPFASVVADPTKIDHMVGLDQSSKTSTTETAAGAMELSDFMVAPGAAISNVPASPTSTLIFSHAMCKLVIKVGIPTLIEGETVSSVKSVEIQGTKVDAKINISTTIATVTAGSTDGVIVPRLTVGDGLAGKISQWEAIVVPQTIKGGDPLVNIVCNTSGGEKKLQYVVPAGQPLSLAQGKKVTLTLSSSADLAFTSELDLLSGLAQSNLPLKIKVPNGTAWSLQSSAAEWLTLSTTSGGSYGATITGTGTGSDQMVYVSVKANSTSSAARESILTLSTASGSIIYGALQNYYKFEVKATSIDITKEGTAVALPEAVANQVWDLTLSGNLPSWLKIAQGTVSNLPTWGAAASVTFPYNVVGSLNSPLTSATLFAVADVTTLSTSREFTVKYGQTVVTIKQAAAKPDNTILINGLYWATGNLVAVSSTAAGVATGTNGTKVKIGAPTDGGLYFQFGSLIGWKGGNLASKGTGVGIPDGAMQTNANYWNGAAFSWANDAMVWPTGMVGTKTSWSNTTGSNISTLSDYYFNYSTAPWSDQGRDLSGFNLAITGAEASGTLIDGRYIAKGVGDPCRYYLGGKWRQPTVAECGNLFNNVYANSTPGGSWPGAGTNWAYNNATIVNGKRSNSITSLTYTGDSNNPLIGRGIYVNTTVIIPPAVAPTVESLFFSASGFRANSNGSFYHVGRYGNYWSASVYTAANGFGLYFDVSYVYPQNSTSRSLGFPVRCVSQP